MKLKLSWRAKLAQDKGLPKVERVTGKMSKRFGTGTVCIPAPREVDELMKRVPRGKVVTTNELRARLARKHRASFGCPITTGIFSLIAARAAEEDAAEGKKRITPWWRTLKAGGELNPKFPGAPGEQRARLEIEGHRIVARGKRLFVEEFERSLARL
jgi:alkylated DNA nucleotide flippase Atl1